MENVEHHGQDLTTGNLRSQLWSLSWPIMLSIFFYTLYNIVDTVWVGKLSPESIAAVSISQISLFVMVAFGMGMTVGSGVLIGMHIGAKERNKAKQVLGQSFVLSVLLGLFLTVLALIFGDLILEISGASGSVFLPAKEYYTVVVAGSVLMFLMMTVVFGFNSQGDNFTPTKLFAASTLLNVFLDPLLIFGYGFVPALGIAGAAYATLISQALFIVAATYMLSRPSQFIPFEWSNLTIEWSSVKEVFRIGFPASLTQIVQPIGLAALMYITALSFHELGTVAFSIAFRLEFFAYLPAIGFGFGSMALIAQNLGAKNFYRAKEAFGLALKYGVVSAVMIGLLAMLFASKLIGVFTKDALVVADVTKYLLIVGSTYGFLAASLISTNVFQAMGHSWSGFWLFVLRFVFVSIPVAYMLTVILDWPISGVWFSLAIGNVAAAVVGVWWANRQFGKLQ